MDKKKLILIVDDAMFVRNSIDFTLSKSGYEVVAATDGYDAIEKATSRTPDLILMDLAMPNLSGFEALKAIKDIEACKNVPVIIITAHATKKHVIEGKSMGIVGFLAKPYSVDTLIRVIEKTIG